MNKEVNLDKTGETDQMNLEVDSKDEMMLKLIQYKRAICDFQQGDGWWARKGNNRMKSGYCEEVEDRRTSCC